MGNKETKDALIGLLSIAELLAIQFKDGVQATDVAEIILKIQADEELKAKLMEAYNGIDAVPSELKDLSVSEGIEMMALALPKLMAIVSAIKK